MKLKQKIGGAMRKSTDHGIEAKYIAPYLLAAALAVASMAVASEDDPTYDLQVAFERGYSGALLA